jgi:hypothetical protein
VLTSVVVVVLLTVVILTHSVIAGSLFALLLLGSYAYSPRGYSISSGSLTVKRLIGNLRIPLDKIYEVRTVVPADFQGGIREFGNGGVFGYYGRFSSPALGRSSWYVTNRSNAVVVRTPAKTAVLSPDDMAGFIAAVRACAPVADQPQPPPAPVAGSASRIGLYAGCAFAVLVAAFVGSALLYSPGLPSYLLTAQSLIIHDKFYPVTVNAVDVDVPGVRVVDLAVDTEWQPTARTNGFANVHYQSGWFRVADGKVVRLYRSGGARLVLLPPKGSGAPVLLQAKDPEAFVEQVKRQWSRS